MGTAGLRKVHIGSNAVLVWSKKVMTAVTTSKRLALVEARLKAVRDLAALSLPVSEPEQIKRESTGGAGNPGRNPPSSLPVSS